MKNFILLFISALIISLFWLTIYIFAAHTLALYLATIFGTISFVVFTVIMLKVTVYIRAQSKHELQMIKKRKFEQEKVFNTISETA